jgi:hypothetical protein
MRERKWDRRCFNGVEFSSILGRAGGGADLTSSMLDTCTQALEAKATKRKRGGRSGDSIETKTNKSTYLFTRSNKLFWCEHTPIGAKKMKEG